ncbi:MAG TPA: hypothetical protein IGR64_00760 [Leptolyngbyaceae cyanobacterium M65_K2018_010]|nr:hypothetical protein [Leptolyngbyaceae cyanobacterium M65_K2018_010]
MNFGTPVPLLLGIFLVLSAVALFFLDRLKPGYGRDADKVYAILFLISGIFLLGNLTMELIPSFQQMIMVGMLISLMIQNVNARVPGGGRPMPQGSGREGYGEGYRPSRPSRPVYGTDGRTNLRAELDRRDFGPEDPYARPRPMLSGREEPGMTSRPPYSPDSYSDPYRGGGPGPDDRLDHPSDRAEGPLGYGNPPRPDERVRRRRPKTRSEYNDRYRVDPGNSPRPDYRPERDLPPDSWS